MRKQTSPTSEIIFSIVNLIDKTNRNDTSYFEINNELSDFENDNVQCKWPIQQVSEGDAIRETRTDTKQQHHTTTNDRRVSKKPWFFFGIMSHQKKQRENIWEQELNREIFYQISLMLESTRKISTMRISFSIFICLLQKI